MESFTRQEKFLNSIATGDSAELEPITREEMYLSAIAGSTESKPEKPITKKEMFYEKILESGGVGGEVGKPYIDTSKMDYFAYFFSKNNLLRKDIKSVDVSNGSDFSNMFASVQDLEIIPPLNTSNGTNFDYMFYSCGVKEIQSLDLSNLKSGSSMFVNCSNLETINIVGETANIHTNYALEFPASSRLKNITIPQGWKNSIYVNKSSVVTVESLHGMIENLADLTGQTAKTFKTGGTNLAKIDEEHIAMLQTKNWNYS